MSIPVADVAAALCSSYPHKGELSNARLTKLVFLCDWLSCQLIGKQLTDIRWYFNNYGPYVDDVMNAVRSDERFQIVESSTIYGNPKLLIHVKSPNVSSAIPGEAQAIVDKVVQETKGLYWNQFIRYIYATYPIAQSERYSYLDLEELAEARTA